MFAETFGIRAWEIELLTANELQQHLEFLQRRREAVKKAERRTKRRR